MEKLDYAPPEQTRYATQFSIVAYGSALAAWVGVFGGCLVGTPWLLPLFPLLSLLAVIFGLRGRQIAGPGPTAARGRATAALWAGFIQLASSLRHC